MRYLNSLPVWQYFRIALLPDAICTVLNIVNPFKKRMDNQGWINYEAVAQDLQAMYPDSRIDSRGDCGWELCFGSIASAKLFIPSDIQTSRGSTISP